MDFTFLQHDAYMHSADYTVVS